MVMELKPMQATLGDIARRHIDYIKSRGEKGASATKALTMLEKVRGGDSDILGTLRTEYFVITSLASELKAEIERMEEES
jgi:hypothetical protein|nr:MAG TPA: hypothetical protein [Caudoviricetes sp.]